MLDAIRRIGVECHRRPKRFKVEATRLHRLQYCIGTKKALNKGVPNGHPDWLSPFETIARLPLAGLLHAAASMAGLRVTRRGKFS